MTEYPRAPIETNSAQPGPAIEGSALSRDEQAELERPRAETAEPRRQAAAPPRRRRFSWRTLVAVVLIFVFWGQPTGLVVIVLVVILLVLLGLIELIGRPPAPAAPA